MRLHHTDDYRQPQNKQHDRLWAHAVCVQPGAIPPPRATPSGPQKRRDEIFKTLSTAAPLLCRGTDGTKATDNTCPPPQRQRHTTYNSHTTTSTLLHSRRCNNTQQNNCRGRKQLQIHALDPTAQPGISQACPSAQATALNCNSNWARPGDVFLPACPPVADRQQLLGCRCKCS